jgi:hypothetical protein
MSLKLYQIRSTLKNHPDCYAILKEISFHNEVFSFFVMNRDEEEKIREINLHFVAGTGYNLKNVAKTDYILTSSAMLFSMRFVERIGEILKKEMQFFPCKVICQDVSLDWYAAKIMHYFPLVDKELSTYRTLTDGTKVLKYVKYREDIEEQFYIAKDIENLSYVAVSDLFKNLCEENGLMISFNQP